jgi:autotransporter-associated beta strand protein
MSAGASSCFRALSMAIAASLACAASAPASTTDNFIGPTDGLWSATGNWDGGVPTSSSDATFATTTTTAVNVNLDVNAEVNSVVFNPFAGGGVTIGSTSVSVDSAQTLTINSGLTVTNNSNKSVIVAPINLGGDQTWATDGASGVGNATAVGLQLRTSTAATAPYVIDLNGHNLIKSGTGEVSFSGTTLTNRQSTGGNITVSGGQLRFSSGADPTPTAVSGPGTITVQSGAALLFNNYTSGALFAVTKDISMQDGSELQTTAGGTPVLYQTIGSNIAWSGTVILDHPYITATYNRRWTFSGNWSGSGTINMTSSTIGTIAMITYLSGNNSGLTGIVDNQQVNSSGTTLNQVIFTTADSGSGNAEWRLSSSTAAYKLGSFNVQLGALSGTAGTLGNYSTLGDCAAIIGGKNISTSFAGTIVDGSTSKFGITKVGTGTQILSGTNTYTGVTTVQAGTLQLNGSGAQAPVLTGTGGADIQGGKMVFDYSGGSSPAPGPTGIQALLTASYNGGAWNTGQFISTTADAAHGLGWADDSVSQLTVAYTWYGDASLDGSVDGTDLGLLIANYNGTGKVWSQGDFNYDGSIDGTDLGLLIANYNQTLPTSISIAGSMIDSQGIAMLTDAGIKVIPEPSSLAMLAALLFVMAGTWSIRRRRLTQ